MSIIGPILLSFVLEATPSQAQSETSERTLVLFGASWCAPCIAEVHDIASLAAAARPERVLIAWTDDGIERIRFDRPDNVELASPQRARGLATAYGAGIVGYPYSVMLDGQGRKCAQWRRRLTPEAVPRMRRSCVDTAR